MPEIIYSHNHKAWIKECLKCDVMFEVVASDLVEAEKVMGEYFAYNLTGLNGLRTECRSCQTSRTNRRQTGPHRDALLEEQEGKCKLCDTKVTFRNKTAFVDHCHVSGITRGVICKRCNIRMAAIDDDQWLARAIAYRDSFR